MTHLSAPGVQSQEARFRAASGWWDRSVPALVPPDRHPVPLCSQERSRSCSNSGTLLMRRSTVPGGSAVAGGPKVVGGFADPPMHPLLRGSACGGRFSEQKHRQTSPKRRQTRFQEAAEVRRSGDRPTTGIERRLTTGVGRPRHNSVISHAAHPRPIPRLVGHGRGR